VIGAVDICGARSDFAWAKVSKFIGRRKLLKRLPWDNGWQAFYAISRSQRRSQGLGRNLGRAITPLLDGNSAGAHPVSRDIAQAARDESLLSDRTTERWTSLDDLWELHIPIAAISADIAGAESRTASRSEGRLDNSRLCDRRGRLDNSRL
jgi:hypothetical protein